MYFIVNEITKTIDKYYPEKIFEDLCHYIYDEKFEKNGHIFYIIRYPGYSFGVIFIDKNNIIKDVKMALEPYKDNEELKKELKKFIGSKLVLTGGKRYE